MSQQQPSDVDNNHNNNSQQLASLSYNHRRRMVLPTIEDRRATSYGRNDYMFSVCAKSKPLLQHLSAVHSGITQVARDYNLSLHPSDVQWLIDHNGRFQKYRHPGSRLYKRTVQSKQYTNKTLQYVKQQCLIQNHLILDVSPRYSGNDLTPNYKDTIETKLCNFWNFLAIIGDYLSMLLLLPHPPRECPSIDHKNLQAFVLHTFGFPNRELYFVWNSTDPSQRVKDRNNNPIITQGGNQCPSSFFALFSGLNYLHLKYAKFQNGTYVEQCSNCLSKFSDQLRAARESTTTTTNDSTTTNDPSSTHVSADPCSTHLGLGPNRYYPYGNPMKSYLHKQLVQYIDKEVQRRNYTANSASPLFPSDVLRIHAHMASKDYHLKVLAKYTMVLGAGSVVVFERFGWSGCCCCCLLMMMVLFGGRKQKKWLSREDGVVCIFTMRYL